MKFLVTLALVASASQAHAFATPFKTRTNNGAISKRTPVEIESQVNALVAKGEMALYGREMATDLTPKVYNLSGLDLHENLAYSNPFISASVFTVTGALSFSSLVTGCIGVGSAGPIASYSCGASLAATSISFLSALYHTYQGFRAIRATLRNNNVSIGLRAVKRGEEGSQLTLSHEEYMEYILNGAGLNGSHIGYHKREGTDYHTPVYQFSNADGRDYHLTISEDENGEVRHSLSFASDSTLLEKRQGYQGVSVNGGLDLDACQRSAGSQSTNPGSASSAYSYIYRDFTCLVTSSELLNSNYVQADLMDTNGNTVLTMGMSPYRSSQADYVTSRDMCSDTKFFFDQSCIN